MLIAILIVLGLCLGSFVNAFVWRIHEKKDWVKERSVCIHCGHQLAAKDLVPVLSWLMLRGKCRYCHAKIDDSPIVEIITAVLFVLSYLYWPLALDNKGVTLFIFWLVFLVGFIALSVYDLKWFLLPDKITFALLSLSVVQVILIIFVFDGGIEDLKSTLLGLLVGGGVFYALFQVSAGRWIGGGDVKLGALIGLILASPSLSFLMIFLASVLGSAVAIPLLLTGKAKKGSHLPFGPFLIAATIIVELFGLSIIAWYKKQFLFI